jgi:RNA-directed DNA polymerase
MMNELEKSDPSIVAAKPANKSGRSDAESVEPREGTKGNTPEPHTHRTQSRASASPGLERVRERARQGKKERFTALLHHVTVDLLRTSYLKLKRDAAPGVDGTTWREYGQDLEAKLVYGLAKEDDINRPNEAENGSDDKPD